MTARAPVQVCSFGKASFAAALPASKLPQLGNSLLALAVLPTWVSGVSQASVARFSSHCWTDFERIASLCDTGTFGGAVDALHIQEPTISRYIRCLSHAVNSIIAVVLSTPDPELRELARRLTLMLLNREVTDVNPVVAFTT